ncbi:hypothetical protein F5B20DRAFT_567816 [Whalleya microplaca]|nr:hypothetical protein F5B20DRAFT_567816 [Whalleya microplaca]
MQKSSATTPTHNAVPFFTTNIWGNSNNKDNNSSSSNKKPDSNSQSQSQGSRSRPGTSSGDKDNQHQHQQLTVDTTATAPKERKYSFGRRPSFSSPSKGKRRASSSNGGGAAGAGDEIKTDASAPPAIPDFALHAAAKLGNSSNSNSGSGSDPPPVPPPIASPPGSATDSFSKMIGRSAPTPTNGFYPSSATSPPILQPEIPSLHQHIQEIANKRISTLDYLRKAHEGRVYWFNTVRFDKSDLARMAYFESRKLARRATNYLLLGLSLPTVIDLNSGTPLEFLRSLNTLLTEFESYQAIHTENGVSTSSLSRARLPQMFRRGTASSKGRRQSGATPDLYSSTSDSHNNAAAAAAASGGLATAPTAVISFGLGGEGAELVAGEEYTHLLTPNLPFDPDFFETFATLCDVLIDVYARLLSLLPSPRDCGPLVAELFTKADARVRKIIVQGVVKEFEDTSRAGLKQEVTNVGKVVLGGLM